MPNSSYYSAMPVREILVESLRFYCERFNVIFLPFLIASLIKSALWKFAFSLIPHFKIQPGFTENFLIQFINYLTIVIPIIIVFVLASWIIDIFPVGSTVKYSSDILEGRPPSLVSSLKTATSKIFPLLSIELIRGALVILGLVLLIIPGIIVAVILSLAIQVMIIEDLGTFESLRRSRELVAKSPWRAFSILMFVFILTALGGVVGEIICSHLIMVEGYIRLVIISVAVSVVKPIQPIALTYLYYSLSASQRFTVRRETYQIISSAPQQTERELREIIRYYPKFCYKCGQKLPSDAIYCPRCGVKVKNE